MERIKYRIAKRRLEERGIKVDEIIEEMIAFWIDIGKNPFEIARIIENKKEK